MATRLKPKQAEAVKGKCFGCAHGAPGVNPPGAPGSGRICGICSRNPEASPDAVLLSDRGKQDYGLRDCYIATDRLEMELSGDTFMKGQPDA
jgi:hypothetical protein